MEKIITLDYGSGGSKTSSLIEELIVPAFESEQLALLADGALLQGNEKLVFSTDSFVVSPYFFPGGDIGKLAVFGTVNDVCMCGGEAKYLSLSLIIEEGFYYSHLEQIVNSIKDAAIQCGVKIVTGDTKVVEKGKCDGIYINTAGIGFLKHEGLGKEKIEEGDAVILSGNMGDHGVAVMLARNELLTNSRIRSDCGSLHRLAACLSGFGEKVKVLRDPTRGGVGTTLNEFTEGSMHCIELEENALPVDTAVANACELLGIEPLYCANEGKLITVVKGEVAWEILEEIRKLPEGKDAAIIGRVTKKHKGKVVLNTQYGGTHIISKLAGAQLPRIC